MWCGRCHDRGVEARLLLTKVKGHGGEYWYFFCLPCKSLRRALYPHRGRRVRVLRHYTSCGCLTASPRVREVLAATLADEERSIRESTST